MDKRPLRDRLLTPGIGYPIPIPVAVYALAWNVFHDVYPLVIRLASLLAHLLTGLTWYVLLSKRTSTTIATVAASVWLLHPLQAESVMWLSNLKSPLQVLFITLAIFVSDRIIQQKIKPAPGTAALSLLTLLALFSKPTGAIAPAAILLPVLLTSTPLKSLRTMGPAAVISGILVGAWAAVGFGDHAAMVDKSHMVTDTFWYRISSGLAAFRRLTEIVTMPWNLGPYYSEPPVIPTVSWASGLVLALAATATFVVAVRKNTELARFLAFSLGTIAVFWAPYSHITFIPRFAADTYAAGPLLGFALMLALPLSQRPKPIAITVIFALAALSFNQRDRWQDGQTLWGDVLQEFPESLGATQHVAFALMAKGQVDEARTVLEKHRNVFKTHQKYPIWIAHFYLGHGDLVGGLNFLAEALEHTKPTEPLNAHRALFLKQLQQSNIPIPPHMFELVSKSIQQESQQSQPALSITELEDLRTRIHLHPDTR